MGIELGIGVNPGGSGRDPQILEREVVGLALP